MIEIISLLFGLFIFIGILAMPIIIIRMIFSEIEKNKYKNANTGNQYQQPTENNEKSGNKCNEFPFYKKKYILTNNEFNFYKKLKQITDKKGLLICTKIRLADIIEVNQNVDYKLKNGYFSKISSKHIDFVILNQNMIPQMFIELDDNSHKKPDRIKRDKFVNAAMQAAGYSLKRIYNHNEEQFNSLTQEIENLV